MTSSALSSAFVRPNDCGFPFHIFRSHAFVMLTMCFDGSGKDDDPQSQHVTLAGFAAEQDAWEYFDAEWTATLKLFGAPFMHMVDAISQTEEFLGWKREKVERLIASLAVIPSKVLSIFPLQGIRFTVDAVAHRKWAESAMPSIPTNLAIGSFNRLFMWYAASPKKILEPMAILFDRNEPYMNVLMQRWNRRKKFKGKRPWWDLVTTIAPVDMRRVPGVQAADMLAWSTNRVRTTGVVDWPGQMAQCVLNTMPHLWNEVEEEHMRKVKLYGELTR